jgi:hypothetical protein
MDIKAAVQSVLDNPRAQALMAQVTTEESKQTIIADLYDMLLRPVRWVLKQEAFEGYIRQHVFRESPEEAGTAPDPATS